MMGKRLSLWRLNNFRIERLPSVADVYLFHAIAHDNPKDERLFACAEVRDVTPVRDEAGRIVKLAPSGTHAVGGPGGHPAVSVAAAAQERLYWNRILLYAWPPLTLKSGGVARYCEPTGARSRGPGPGTGGRAWAHSQSGDGRLRDMQVRVSNPGGRGLLMTFRPATKLQPLKPLSEYDQKVVRMRQRGMIYPYEIIKMLTPARDATRGEFPPGDFLEYDLSPQGRLMPVDSSLWPKPVQYRRRCDSQLHRQVS